MLTVELDAQGRRVLTMNINTSSTGYTPSKVYDLRAMLSTATANLSDPEWLDQAYPSGGEV